MKKYYSWIVIAVLAVALVAAYATLTFRIQDTEKRLFEAQHQLRTDFENYRYSQENAL